jgi:hypothetical protein
VKVNDASFTLTRDVDAGHYAGTANVTLSGSSDAIIRAVSPNGSDGPVVVVTFTVDAPPAITLLAFTGGYPGTQSELKAGDTYQVTGTTNIAATGVEVLDFGAGTSQFISFSSATSFTVAITVANRGTTVQALQARLRAKNAAGAYGSAVTTSNTVNCNNLYPTCTFGAITYPAGQGALKDAETATVAVTTANLDSILFTSPNFDLSITSPTSIGSLKTVGRIGGSYNVATSNLQAVATRAANAAATTTAGVVKIANVAATVTVVTPYARLRSGGNDGTTAPAYSISLQSTQELYQAPLLSSSGADGGLFAGVWAGGPSTWTRNLTVRDRTDTKGTLSWTSLNAINLSGMVTSTVTTGATYILGGFIARNLTFAAWQQATALNVVVTNYSKLTAGVFTATNQPALRNATLGNHDNIANTFTVDALGVNPASLYWNDVSAAGSNSGGTAQIQSVQETV